MKAHKRWLWAVVSKKGVLINWRSKVEPMDEGFEVHRTKKAAKGAAFSDERVVQIKVIWLA
jgi:hypothetical protein